MQKSTSISTVKSLIKETIFEGRPLIELTNDHVSAIKAALFSPSSKLRKIASILILHLSYQNSFFQMQFRKKKLTHNFEGYTGISVNRRVSCDNHCFFRFLKRDPDFLKVEKKCNRLLIKYLKKTQDPKAGKVKLVTMTELKYYLENNCFEEIPDPLKYALWFFKKQDKEEFVCTNLEFSDQIEKLKKKKLRREMRKIKKEKACCRCSSSSGSEKKKGRKRKLKICSRSSKSRGKGVKRGKSFQLKSRTHSSGKVWKRRYSGSVPKKKIISHEQNSASFASNLNSGHQKKQKRLFISSSLKRKLRNWSKGGKDLTGFERDKENEISGERQRFGEKASFHLGSTAENSKVYPFIKIKKKKKEMKEFRLRKEFISDRVIRSRESRVSSPKNSINLSLEEKNQIQKKDGRKSFFFKISKNKLKKKAGKPQS